MIYGMIVSLVMFISIAYILLTLANRETGNMKLIGQVLSALVAIIAVVALIHGFSARGRYGMMHNGMPGEKGMPFMMEKMKQGASGTQEASKIIKTKWIRHQSKKNVVK